MSAPSFLISGSGIVHSIDFEIEYGFVDKDESSLTYRLRRADKVLALASIRDHGSGNLYLGKLQTWEDGTAMSDEERAHVIETVSQEAFSRGIKRVLGPDDVAFVNACGALLQRIIDRLVPLL